MLQLFSFTSTLICLLLPCTIMTMMDNNYSNNEALSWAEVTATRLVTCYYDNSNGLFRNELAWQSGNTLESIANLISLLDSPIKYIFYQSYVKTGMFIGGDCYDVKSSISSLKP